MRNLFNRSFFRFVAGFIAVISVVLLAVIVIGARFG